MALLTLNDIGKIYVSESNVTVGIRGVNLAFDKGEFVAITGKSGSGKSTLLNVMSGMDSYEEGDLLIEGNSTRHYLQPEWEKYREDYISFIFQEYNIIESFTVLENVELALMSIKDKKARRARALELIDKVGLSSHIKHKGSKLSGGQKQRTVIARALAKDSPIILADEPTGNLDSATSKEIIELLYEISANKLVIVVTHNFDQLEDYATRHIRIFDGAVESDVNIRERDSKPAEDEVSEIKTSEAHILSFAEKKKRFTEEVKDGFTLGKSIFTSKPRLSLFLCLLMIIGTLGIFAVTCACGIDADATKPSLMFNHIDGRVIITTQNGTPITDEEIAEIAEKFGAESYLHYDVLLDNDFYIAQTEHWSDEGYYYYDTLHIMCTYGESFGDNIIGRYPEAENEVFLYLPISYEPEYGKNELIKDTITLFNTDFKVTGVKYFYDNNKTPKCLFTEKGFKTATAIYYLCFTSSNSISITFDKSDELIMPQKLVTAFDIPEDKIYIDHSRYKNLIALDPTLSASVKFTSIYYQYNMFYGSEAKTMLFEHSFDNSSITNERPNVAENPQGALIVSDEIVYSICSEVLSKSYKQASLFFKNDKEAHAARELLKEAGYIAVTSDTTYTADGEDAIFNMFLALATALVWIAAIVFLVFFIQLCSSRSLEAFKSDMAIMRSMGIRVRVIQVGMYVRMLFSLIPAFILVAIAAHFVYTSPTINPLIAYMYGWQYAVLYFGMLILTAGVTRKQIKRLFGESVKKSLKGGAEK